MSKILIIILIILIIALVFFSFPTKCKTVLGENFSPTDGYYKNYCPTCGWKSRYSCSGCSNCGYCITADGSGECVPGDSSGPFFREDCVQWEFDTPYSYYPANRVYPVTITRFNPNYRYMSYYPPKWFRNNLANMAF